MPKTTGPLLSFDARGSLGDKLAFAKNGAKTYAKKRTAPKNPRSAGQVLTRDTMGAANKIWKQAPPLFTGGWNFTVGKKPTTGFASWVGRYIKDNRGSPDFTKLVFAEKLGGGIDPASIVVTPGPGEFAVFFNLPTPPLGWFLLTQFAACIRNQDPAALPFPLVTLKERAFIFTTVFLFPLTPGVEYVVSGWLLWLLPGNLIAISQSLPVVTATPL